MFLFYKTYPESYRVHETSGFEYNKVFWLMRYKFLFARIHDMDYYHVSGTPFAQFREHIWIQYGRRVRVVIYLDWGNGSNLYPYQYYLLTKTDCFPYIIS